MNRFGAHAGGAKSHPITDSRHLPTLLSRIVALETEGLATLRFMTTSRYAFGPKTTSRMLIVAGNGRRPTGRRPDAHDVGISVVTLTCTGFPRTTVVGAEMRTHSFACATAGSTRAAETAATPKIGSERGFTLALHQSNARSSAFRQCLLVGSSFGRSLGLADAFLAILAVESVCVDPLRDARSGVPHHLGHVR